MFDVFDHHFRPAKVRDPWRHAVIVHGVSQVAHEDDVLSLGDELPNAEGSTQHAHIDVHAHDNDIGDTALAHQIKGFDRISDGIAIHDFDRGMLPTPCLVARAIGTSVTAAVGVVDGQRWLFDPIQLAPPLEGDFRFHHGRHPGQLAAGMIVVKIHGVAGTMNNEHPLRTGHLQDVIHPRRHFRHPRGRIRTMMSVPHVAHHHRRARRIPLPLRFHDFRPGRIRPVRSARSQAEIDRVSRHRWPQNPEKHQNQHPWYPLA